MDRLPRIALVVFAVGAAVAGGLEASSTSGLLSLVSAGAGLAGYLLFFWSVADSLYAERAPEQDEEEGEEGGRSGWPAPWAGAGATMDLVRRILDVLIALCGVAGVTAVGWLLFPNATTAVVAFFLLVLGLSVWRGIVAGVVGSFAATACFNYFFIPPVGTFRVADPANWVALGSFLAASTVASRLVVMARRRAEEADARRREVEGLYELSLNLFAATSREGALREETERALRALGADGGGLVFPGQSGPADLLDDPIVEAVRLKGVVTEVPGPSGMRDVYLPVALGARTTGVLVARRVRADRAALQSVARLVALSVEREALLAERSHLEALRESDLLKTSLLRAVSHDLRSPLTAMRLGVGSLRRLVAAGGNGEVRSALETVEREAERLNRRIDNLLALARLEAGVVTPRPEPTPAADLFRGVREALSSVLSGQEPSVRVDPDCPDLLVDPGLALEILVNLVENAARVSPPGVPVGLAAGRSDEAPGRVVLDVLDRGPGLPTATVGPGDASRLEGTAEGRRGYGLGLQIAHGLATACNGTVELVPRPGGGTIARVDLPATAAVPAAPEASS